MTSLASVTSVNRVRRSFVRLALHALYGIDGDKILGSRSVSAH
jgi:hypothetical protein